MSESSYESTNEEVVEVVIAPESITKGTQVDFAPYRHHHLRETRHRRLHRNHTSAELLVPQQKSTSAYLRTSTLNRPSSKYRVESAPVRPTELACALGSRSDSGFGSDSVARFRPKPAFADSPTLSLTPPHSLDYLYAKGEHGSSMPSVLPSGVSAAKANGGLFLSPSYLQPYSKYNQSGSELQVVVSGAASSRGGGGSSRGGPPSGASSCRGCSCRGERDADAPPAAAAAAQPPLAAGATADGLSWRRLHMSRAKLKATATTSELLSGFAMVAMVELQINEPTNVPEWLFVMFAVCTTVLVAVHIFALMISTYLLPTIDAVSKMGDGGLAGGGPYGDGSSAALHVIRESPHERMRGFIELAWAFSTVLGLFLFLVEIAILCWVKFWDYSFAAATAATIIVIPVLIVFVAFAVHFYHSLVVHKCDTSEEDMEQLENMKRNLDTATIKANSPV